MRVLFALAIACSVACDSRATASDPAASRAEQKSREYETCSASVQCQDDLRCFDGSCRRTARSTLGDYFAAAGKLEVERSNLEGAIASYAQALSHYDADKLALPPDIDCAYGAALATARAGHAELGARVLHRCILAAPVGSHLHDDGLRWLAVLAAEGLDPTLLAGTKLADLYLTRGPIRQPTKLVATVSPSPAPTGKSYALIPDKVSDGEVQAALVACGDAYNTASHKDTVSVTIGVKSVYVASEYEDEPGTYVVKLDPPAPLPPASPEAAADTCVRKTLEPAIKGLKLTDQFATKLAVTIKPASG